ncbi:MAG: NUDIX domain-containing protein [Candidatus Magasanikbacteria bacterium]|jgi:hypothetical protein|nr:NUDIX domain-containing protein [Candidatus Magasanikbacteria bacterium]MBT5262342.1 NUDIX domain-containing protein [Candidatus Magasanikbacteria bacterium]MBT5820160.1 NUDIX domain-containing protein [Candidatus Magasanikbacteria bacterium]
MPSHKQGGKMAATISLFEAEQKKPGFIADRPTQVPWLLSVTHKDGACFTFTKTEWKIESKFGSISNVVVCNAEGEPQFEKPEFRESPNVHVIAYGFRGDELSIAVLHEGRPHADNPNDPKAKEVITFGQTPMGYMDKIIGKNVVESTEDAGTRELTEEVGSVVIKKITKPDHPYHNPNPSFVATWSDIVFIEVDLETLGQNSPESSELIYKAEYVPVKELLRRIKVGEHEGALYRSCTTNGSLMLFFATFPEYFIKA